jgi:ABC-type multidrug transport system fused ATPase/permease subunit
MSGVLRATVCHVPRSANSKAPCPRSYLRQMFSWPSPLRDEEDRPVIRTPLPSTLFGLVARLSLSDQLWIVILSIVLVILDTVPIELQRRLVNSLKDGRAFEPILLLALCYAGVIAAQGLLKLLSGIYRSWVSENAVRSLRSFIDDASPSEPIGRDSQSKGIEISIIVAECEPVGGFVGASVAEPVQQIGVLVAVFGYLTYLDPLMALITLLVFSPQFVLVPIIQLTINRRVQRRISTIRKASASVVGEDPEAAQDGDGQQQRFEKIFRFNMSIFKLKLSLNFAMNLTHHLGTVIVLALGGWYTIHGQMEVGTVVAFVSGLSTIHDPWGDLVTWFQNYMVTSAKYELIATALKPLPKVEQKFTSA